MRLAVLLAALLACGHAAPVTSLAPAARVVDPDATFTIVSEEVTFTAGDRTIAGTIVAPRDRGPWPAVILLAGSGPTDRDWNSPLLAGTNGSAKLLAEELAKRGAVVLRFDKAGTGATKAPPPAEMSIDTYRAEGLAALAFVRARPDVRAERVFVAGSSEGGVHAVRLAQVAKPQLAGLVFLATPGRRLADVMLAQLEAQLRHPLALMADEKVDAELRSLRAAFDDVIAGRPVDPKAASTLPPLQQLVASFLNPANGTVLRDLFGYDVSVEAAKLAVPMLVVNGGKDLQVDPEIDARKLEAALRAANRDVTLHIAPDADHVLKHQPKATAELRANLPAAQAGYNAADRVLDADVVRAVSAWLATHSR